MIRKVEYKGAEVVCDVVADRYVFDTELVVNGDTEKTFYVSLTGKGYNLANFEGDKTIVPEQRIFETLAVGARIVEKGVGATNPLISDAHNMFEAGYFTFSIQEALTDRDFLQRIAGGFDVFEIGGVGTAFMGDGAIPNVRKYSVSRLIPGGRSIEFKTYWPGPGGVVLTPIPPLGVYLQVWLYGYELIPRARV